MKTRARFLTWLIAFTAATIVGVALDGGRAAGQASGQAPAGPRPAAQPAPPPTTQTAPARSASRSPRTAWGTPDLQGIWSNNILVPLERPREFGTRAFMTQEEHAKALAELQVRNQRPGRDSREVGGKPAIGTEKDVARAYNEFWFGDKPKLPGTLCRVDSSKSCRERIVHAFATEADAWIWPTRLPARPTRLRRA